MAGWSGRGEAQQAQNPGYLAPGAIVEIFCRASLTGGQDGAIVLSMNAAQKTQWIDGCERQIAGLLDGFEWDLANDGECFEETLSFLNAFVTEYFEAVAA